MDFINVERPRPLLLVMVLEILCLGDFSPKKRGHVDEGAMSFWSHWNPLDLCVKQLVNCWGVMNVVAWSLSKTWLNWTRNWTVGHVFHRKPCLFDWHLHHRIVRIFTLDVVLVSGGVQKNGPQSSSIHIFMGYFPWNKPTNFGYHMILIPTMTSEMGGCFFGLWLRRWF